MLADIRRESLNTDLAHVSSPYIYTLAEIKHCCAFSLSLAHRKEVFQLGYIVEKPIDDGLSVLVPDHYHADKLFIENTVELMAVSRVVLWPLDEKRNLKIKGFVNAIWIVRDVTTGIAYRHGLAQVLDTFWDSEPPSGSLCRRREWVSIQLG